MNLPQYMPYGLLIGLFVVLTCNALSPDHLQQATRPVLLATTLLVVSLVIIRQILTLRAHGRLLYQQEHALQQLTYVHQQLEEQSRTLLEQNTELAQGMDHLNRVLIQLANGNLQARAALTNSVLWPLGVSVNVLAEHVSQDVSDRQQMTEALAELSTALQQAPPFSIPDICSHISELGPLLSALQAYDESSGPLSRQFRLLPRSPYATRPHPSIHEGKGLYLQQEEEG